MLLYTIFNRSCHFHSVHIYLWLAALKHLLHHLVAHHLGLGKARLKELLRAHKPLPPRVEMAQRHALGPRARRKRKLEVVAAKRLVLDRRRQRLVQQRPVAEQVLRHAQPQPEQRRAAQHVVVRHDAELRPAVHHGQQREVVVGAARGRVVVGGLAERKRVEDRVLDEGPLVLAPRLGAKDLVARGKHAPAQAGQVADEHELVEVGDAARVLRDLLARLGVEDGEAGVDMPFLAVDAQHEVDFDVFDAADVAAHGPRELPVGVPRLAHGEESGVCDGLRVGRDAVVLSRGEVHEFGPEAAQHRLDLVQRGVGRAVLDEHEGLVGRVDTGPVEGVAGDDVDVGGEVLLEGGDFGRLAGRLSADNGAHFRGCGFSQRGKGHGKRHYVNIQGP